MLGIITLFIALSAQLGFLIYRIVTKDRQTRIKHVIRIAAFIIFALLMATGVYWWGFRWISLFILLAILAVFSAVFFIRKPVSEKKYKRSTAILSCVNGCFMLTFLILPGILFPQFTPVAPTGSYAVNTTSVTFVDDSRIDPFSGTDENRKLTVQFWYPDLEKGTDTFPLAVFSHGAFGYRGSNISTFEDLASNGYVVCSIDHSYQAFFAKHTDGSMTFVNTAFLNDAVNITNGDYDNQATYTKTHEWLALRTDDINFVLNKILNRVEGEIPESIGALINEDKIGLFGHSLGGAAAAQMGRERPDVDAVIVIDGTMIGEETGFENGQAILTREAYPVPLLNLYNDSHYEDARQLGTAYNNLSASAHAAEAYDIVIRDSGHLNFTDLPLFSPTFARMLGTGEVDSSYCIKTMNDIVLDFFNYTLKDTGTLQLKTEY
ncbi:putative dienelactone hydrolase [Anaerotaenia torta]|uniref:alpha/beta hydrolase family protein n=1 Tax=Anaerotaenia torta TaxID=433293 RepID=UPI003D262E5C